MPVGAVDDRSPMAAGGTTVRRPGPALFRRNADLPQARRSQGCGRATGAT
ncbi:hypothetical protein OG564_13685 [Streptomyces sp. NBC_01280]|nr:hypothetical protein [Streptomyces sp. NBC_01280]